MTWLTGRRPTRRDPRLPALALVAAVGLLSGCGSTVQVRGSLAASGPAQQDASGGLESGVVGAAPGSQGGGAEPGSAVGTDGGGLVTSSPGRSGSEVTSGARTAPGSRPTSGPSSGAAAPRGGARTAPGSRPTSGPSSGAAASRGVVSNRPANVPGVTDTTLKLGVEYISTAQLGAFADAAGVKAVGKTDMLKAYQAAVDEVNGHGGVAGGRKIVIVPRERKTSETNATSSQASCAAFTEDDRVFAANGAVSQDSPLVPCLTKRGVLSVSAGLTEAGSRQDFQRYGGLYVAPSTAETVSSADSYVEALVRQGLLKPGTKVGLIWFDFTDFQVARASGLLPALARHGLKLTTEYRSHYGGDPSELGNIASQMQSAVVQFRAAGVDRVLSLDYNGTLSFFFAQQAQQQGYKPVYGLASWSNVEFLAGNGLGAQLAGASGIGWLPANDVAPHRQPTTPALAHCLAVMKAHGMPPVEAQGDAVLQYRACAEVFFLKALLDEAPDLTAAGLRQARAALGQQPAYAGFGDRFSADRAWGSATYRDLYYDAGCQCAQYRGADRSLS